MANYNSPYTGAEVDASVAKTQALPAASDVTSAVEKTTALAPATDINEAIQPAAASSGDVWTADGAGGAAWVTPEGGGGTQLYMHTITNFGGSYAPIYIITTDATPKTTFLDVYYMWEKSLACYIVDVPAVMYISDTTHIKTTRWNGVQSTWSGSWNGGDTVLNTRSVTDTVTAL